MHGTPNQRHGDERTAGRPHHGAQDDARLQAKGLLVRSEGETPIRFRAAVARQQLLPALIGQFVEQVLGGSAEPLLAYFGNSQRLSAKDLVTLKAIAGKIQDSPKKR